MKFHSLAAAGMAAAMAISLFPLTAVRAEAAPPARSVALPRRAELVTPVARSGAAVLIQAGGTFRLSKDSGKTWKSAKVHCADRADCDPTGSLSLIGRVADGVVSIFNGNSPQARNLSAFSLRTNSVVGRPYQPAADEQVLDLSGARALLRDGNSGTMTVRSLADGSTRQVAGSSAYSYGRLLADGSVIVHANANPGAWDRISPAGVVTPFISAATAGLVISGSLVAFGSGTGRLCVVEATTAIPDCRSGLGAFEIAQVSPRGVLIQRGTGLRWLPVSNGRLGAATSVPVKLTAGGYRHALSVENAYPVISQKTSTGVRTLTLRSGGRLSIRHLGWARASVLPDSLQLTPAVVLGRNGNAKAWRRGAVASLGARKTIAATGDVVASGARWAVGGSTIALYDRGTADRRLQVGGSAVAVSGAQLLVAPACSLPLGDPNATCPTNEIYSVTGRKLATIAADGIFGDLAVVRDGVRGAGRVVRYAGIAETLSSFQLPDPGPQGNYAALRLWGDWVAGTRDEGTDQHAVVYNYRTGQVRVSPSSATLEALGDGFAVIHTFRAANDRQLQVWNLATGSTTTLSSVSSLAATDGSRVAYLSGDPFDRFTRARLAVTSFASFARTAPRVVGVVAPLSWKKSWSVDVDLTKAVRAGQLEFRDAGGNLVRSVRVPASRDGSLRDVRWDGRDAAGRKLPAGAYSYRLTNVAADGTGRVRAADGTSAPLGTVVVG